jgi:hypothetical protein
VFYVASTTVQPLGIPLVPLVQLDILAALVNVPLEATRFTQLDVQPLALITFTYF